MVYVSEGKATIGVSSDAFYSTTGFQLYYYGENPDFSALLTPALAEVNAKIDGLAWEGDKAAAKAIIATIPETIAGQEAYQNALAAIAEANQYVATATAAINGWTALEDFAKLQANYEEDSDEFDILATAWLYTMRTKPTLTKRQLLLTTTTRLTLLTWRLSPLPSHTLQRAQNWLR